MKKMSGGRDKSLKRNMGVSACPWCHSDGRNPWNRLSRTTRRSTQ